MADDFTSRSIFLTVVEAGSMIVFNILALLGNILVCISVYRNMRLRTTTNLYIIALALSDLSSAVFVMPFASGVLLLGRWPFGETLCEMHAFFSLFVVYISPVTMCLTAFNRYVRICKPDHQYKRLFSPKKSLILLVSAWIIVASYILIPRLVGIQRFHFVPGYAACLNEHLSKVSRITHYVVVVGLVLVLPLAVTIFSYNKISKTIREHNVGAVQALHTQGGNARISSHEIRICKSLFVIVFAFMVCWVPAWVITILTRFRVAARIPRNIELLCAFCLSLSNIINPFIYAGMNPLFRKEFRKILRCESGQEIQDIPGASSEIPVALLSRSQAGIENNGVVTLNKSTSVILTH